jgi:hypothetical protein
VTNSQGPREAGSHYNPFAKPRSGSCGLDVIKLGDVAPMIDRLPDSGLGQIVRPRIPGYGSGKYTLPSFSFMKS